VNKEVTTRRRLTKTKGIVEFFRRLYKDFTLNHSSLVKMLWKEVKAGREREKNPTTVFRTLSSKDVEKVIALFVVRSVPF
jgi:hypothetical protein